MESSTSTKARLVLMSCGSYNPPTHMHLRMFERARDHLHKLGTHVVVGGVISPVNDAYSKKELAAGEHRCEMLKLALQDSDWIRLSTWEIRQQDWTRTRLTLQRHQSLLNAVVQGSEDANRNNLENEDLHWIPESVKNNETQEQTPILIKLLCGGDLLESFATPGLWAEEDIEEIVGKYGLIVITRVGSNPYKFIYDSDILSKHLHNIQIVTEWIPNEVSSTRIRRALKRGESVKYLLQDAVIDYVYANGIYGADRPSTIKLEFSSYHSSTDYLDADEASKYHHDNAFLLTPSPSDITMRETSPCDATTTTTTTTTTIIIPTTTETAIITTTTTTTNDEFLPDTVLQKNLQNNCSSPRFDNNSDDLSSSLEEDNSDTAELAREKFFRSLVNDSLHLSGTNESSSSLLPLQPSSARARNELLAFDDVTTESELATLCGDNTYSDERDDDALSITYEESSEDAMEASSVRNNHKYNNSDDTTSTTTPRGPIDTANESPGYENLAEDSDSQATKFEANLEIDGKYIKSLVNSKKSTKKTEDDDSVKSSKEEEDQERMKLDLVDSTPESTEEMTVEEKVEEEAKKDVKLFEDDISYIKRLRLIINDDKPADNNARNQRQQLQGSLDSINLNETRAAAITRISAIESMSKKSKSFESIKRNALPMSFKTSEISYCDDSVVSKNKSDSTSQLVTAAEFDAPTEEFCSACSFANNTPPFYALRSDNCSSPEDEDSTECDICSSCNLRDDSNDALECNNVVVQQQAHSLSETTEICEICGEPATSTDEPLTDDPKTAMVINSRPMPLSLPKAKSTIEISRGSYRRSTLHDEDRFEIDNCGLQECRLRASLDTCNKPEPLYVNVTPRHHRQLLLIKSSKPNGRSEGQPYSESECYNQELRYIGPKDEVAMSRSLSIGGRDKRMSRKGSYAKNRSITDRINQQEKRRYSSVDNLQNRTLSFRSSGEKFSKSRDNKFMTSADSIRPRVARSRSLRRSADNVGRFDSSGDNLDSLEETVDTDDNGVETTGTSSAGNTGNVCTTRVKIRDSDTIKMILTKHGIKIISQKETVL